jgi:hypothetical protein
MVWRTDVGWREPQSAYCPRRLYRLRRGNPGLLRRCGRLILAHPVAGHCVVGHPVDVRCRYRYAGRHGVSDSVSYTNRHADANANANGLRDRHSVTQPLHAVAEPVQAVSDARAEAIAYSVRDPECPAVPDRVRLAAARHSRLT